MQGAFVEADGLEAFPNDEAVAFDEGLLEVLAHEIDGRGIAQALPESGLVEVLEAGVDVAGGATVGLEDDRTEAALDALDNLLVLAVFGLRAARCGVAGLELGLAVEVREAARVNDGSVRVVFRASGETEEVVRAGAIGEVGLAEGVEAAHFA